MTPDAIITAELLASMSKCPFCGAAQTRIRFGEWASYECLSSFHVNQKASRTRSIPCEQTECATLRARVQELQAKVQRLTEAGDQMATIVGQKGDPGLWVTETECDEAVGDWNKAKKGTK